MALANKHRPNSFKDIIGNSKLVGSNGIFKKMIETSSYSNVILYGNPGTGKTSIARCFANESKLNYTIYNASIDNKDKLKAITSMSNLLETQLLIVDEIHRMKSDIQDYLLPLIENGSLILLGLTTLNPYRSVNDAIRSRCLIYKTDLPTKDQLINGAIKLLNTLDPSLECEEGVLEKIVVLAGREYRSVINIIEASLMYLNGTKVITLDIVKQVCDSPNLKLDDKEDNYYLLISGLQKSIRGSDVDSALFYLASLLVLQDLEIIMRRLMVIAYEDIGLANPSMGEKVNTVYQIVKLLGFPECRIPLSQLVIELCLCPKSNSALLAIDRALEVVNSGKVSKYPDYIDNNLISRNSNIYEYAHDYPSGVSSQSYLPQEIKNEVFYLPKDTSKYETQLKERLAYLDSIKKKKRS